MCTCTCRCVINCNFCFVRSNNPVLLKFLQNLTSVTTDVLIQELVITVLSCCQDLVTPFLSSMSATYEPRLSMPWIANMNLVTKVRKWWRKVQGTINMWPFTQKRALTTLHYMSETNGYRMGYKWVTKPFEMGFNECSNGWLSISIAVCHRHSLQAVAVILMILCCLTKGLKISMCNAFRRALATLYIHIHVQARLLFLLGEALNSFSGIKVSLQWVVY